MHPQCNFQCFFPLNLIPTLAPRLTILDTAGAIVCVVCYIRIRKCLLKPSYFTKLEFSAFPQMEGLEILPVMISGYNLSAHKSKLCFISQQRLCMSLTVTRKVNDLQPTLSLFNSCCSDENKPTQTAMFPTWWLSR